MLTLDSIIVDFLFRQKYKITKIAFIKIAQRGEVDIPEGVGTILQRRSVASQWILAAAVSPEDYYSGLLLLVTRLQVLSSLWSAHELSSWELGFLSSSQLQCSLYMDIRCTQASFLNTFDITNIHLKRDFLSGSIRKFHLVSQYSFWIIKGKKML